MPLKIDDPSTATPGQGPHPTRAILWNVFSVPTVALPDDSGRLFPDAHHGGLQPTQLRAVWRLPPKAGAGGPVLHHLHSTASGWRSYMIPPSAFMTLLSKYHP